MQIEMNSHFVKVVYQINIKVSLEYAKLVVIIIVFIFAVLLVTIPQVKDIFFYLNKFVQHLQEATEFGTSFVFGYLGGADLPFKENQGGTSFIFAFKATYFEITISHLNCLLKVSNLLAMLTLSPTTVSDTLLP